jgi:hypothetical protein
MSMARRWVHMARPVSVASGVIDGSWEVIPAAVDPQLCATSRNCGLVPLLIRWAASEDQRDPACVRKAWLQVFKVINCDLMRSGVVRKRLVAADLA